MNPPKKKLIKRREFRINNQGNVEVLNDTLEEKLQKEEPLSDFVNRTTYKLEPCKEDLFRMTKEKTSVTLIIDEDSVQHLRIVSPSIIYLNDNGQVLEVIPQERKTTLDPKKYNSKRI